MEGAGWQLLTASVLGFGDFQIDGLTSNEGELAMHESGTYSAVDGSKHGKQVYLL